METHNHLLDALDSGYLTASEHQRLAALCERALKATTALHSYLLRTPNRRRG